MRDGIDPKRSSTQEMVAKVALGGVAVLLLLLALLGTWYPEHVLLKAVQKWQESIAAGVAVLAASYAANFALAQLRQTKDLEDTRLARQRRAWLATMPSSMSTVADYAQRSYRYLLQQHAVAIQAGGLTKERNPVSRAPRFEESVLSDVRSMIEVAHAGEAALYMELLSELQVHRARWRGRVRELRADQNILAATLENEMVEAAELYARASNLLGAARPNALPEDKNPMSRRKALWLMAPRSEALPAVATMAERRDTATPLTAP